MSGIIALILVALGVFLFWFGYEVGSGKHKADPNDKFFPLFGRNIDYVIGTSGILLAIAMFILAFGVWAEIRAINYVAAVIAFVAIARAYLPPEKFGPRWYRDKKAKKRRSKPVKRRKK